MPQSPQIPQVPVLSYFDPNKVDRGLIEYYSTETAAYVALDLGTPHPNTRDYPGFRLGLQQAVPFNPGWIRRVYVSDETNPDWFNAQEKFSAESDAHPIFIRSYREDKKTYVPRTKLAPLDTVIKLVRDLPGSGYTPGTFPNLTFIGGGGSGAMGHAVVAVDGTIAELVLDDGGQDFTSAPTFTIDPPTSGITATGTASIQPQTALLVAEEAKEYPSDSEFFGLYFDVIRVYETLPGPILTTKTVGQDNLTPAKYRRLIRTEATDQPVPSDYVFPPGLSGDQTQIRLQQETIAKARLQIISEIIAIAGDALIGGELDEYGQLTIYETVVNEGTPIDQGFLVLKSSVTPFGNGKAVKITVKYPANLALIKLLDHSLGQPNLTPAKYRRLVRQDTTRQKVDPTSYIFPPFLSGDQVQLNYIQETITRARLETLEEIIATTGDALIGGEGDEFGVLRIEETVVNEGAPIDQGFLIKHSSVTPFGNGKAVKITVIYTNAVITAVQVTNGGAAGVDGTHTNGSFTGGSGSGATFTYVISGGILQNTIVITNLGSGYTGLPVAVAPSAVGATMIVYLAGPLLTSRLYDEEMQVHYNESRQIVMIGTPDSPDQDYVTEETKALDVWRSLRTRTRKIPTATDEASAIISFRYRPYAFPGLLPTDISIYGGFSNHVIIPFYFRKTRADLIQTKIKTWWVLSSTTPTVAVDEIITDTVFVNTVEPNSGNLVPKTYEGVLHDAFGSTFYTSLLTIINNYLATTPSYTDYITSWRGTERFIAASITPTREHNLWRVEGEFIVMR